MSGRNGIPTRHLISSKILLPGEGKLFNLAYFYAVFCGVLRLGRITVSAIYDQSTKQALDLLNLIILDFAFYQFYCDYVTHRLYIKLSLVILHFSKCDRDSQIVGKQP